MICSFIWAFFFSPSQWACYIIRGRALDVHQGGAACHLLWRCTWGRGLRGSNGACSALCGFQSLPPLPTSKLGPSGGDSWVDGFVYILGPCGSLQWTLLWGWEFFPLPQPPQIFTTRSFEALFTHTGTLGWMICLTPHLFLPIHPHANVGPPAPQLPPLHRVCQQLPCHKSSSPGCPSPNPLPVWMNVSSLTPWLSDFHTLWFSVSSGGFCF